MYAWSYWRLQTDGRASAARQPGYLIKAAFRSTHSPACSKASQVTVMRTTGQTSMSVMAADVVDPELPFR